MKIYSSLLFICSFVLLSFTPLTQTATTPQKVSKTVSNKFIKLYTYPNCRYCHNVINFLKKKGWYDRVVIVNANEEENYQKLKELSGKDYCPYLVDEIHGKNMGDSRKIMDYLKEIFSEADDNL